MGRSSERFRSVPNLEEMLVRPIDHAVKASGHVPVLKG